MDSETQSLIEVWVTAIASLCYCYFVSANLPKGKPRLLSLIPVVALFAYLPHRLSAVISTGLTSVSLTWLGNSKLLLLAFDSGPLHNRKPLPIFVILACLPINVRPKNYERPAALGILKLPLIVIWAVKALIFAILIASHCYKDLMGPRLLMALYSCMFYLFNDITLGFYIHVVRVLVGVELEPPSDEPYLSTSLQDFWGRRWNLTVTGSLRQTVYKPIRWALQPVLGVRVAILLAVFASFLVSGLMHELMFYYITRDEPTWEVMWFFVFHGMFVILEFKIKEVVKGRWRLHPAVSGPMTVAFVIVTAMRWFYPPLVRSGAFVRSIEECKALVQVMMPKPRGN